MSWLTTRLKAFRQLGPQAVALYAWHQVSVRSGWQRRRTPPGGYPALPGQLKLAASLFSIPNSTELRARLGEEGATTLLAEADEIVAGQVRLFGGPALPLQLEFPGPLQHWTAYENGLPSSNPGFENTDLRQQDIKFTWEPGRFGWVIVLARAYQLSENHIYAQSFWTFLETFLAANPPNLGPHWASAQEVAMRLIALVFAGQVFASAPQSTAPRRERLAQVLVDHAERIPPSLAYARAQQNNHLISEAAGLYTAGLALPHHHQASHWRELGWRWLNQALQTQITPSGAYSQHSTNYHRLVLQAALWAGALARHQHQAWPERTRQRLAAATRWLLALCNPESGKVPNLGPNDGALIFPLAACPYDDYRPTLSAAALAFLNRRCFPDGPWNEPALWLGLALPDEHALPSLPTADSEPLCLHAPDGQSWAYLRLAHFNSRPGHADQLHLDLWWRGLNLAQDAGTYLYNAAPPWDNALTHTAVHNTLTVNGLEQMTRAGRFLYLDWAQARLVRQEYDGDSSCQRVTAEHDGYRRLGLRHQRSVEYQPSRWIITDLMLPGSNPASATPLSLRLHWLLPDLPWEMDVQLSQVTILLRTPPGMVKLCVHSPGAALRPLLARAGQRLMGAGPVHPTWGWTAPTYGYKIPSLSFSISLSGTAPLSLTSEWELPSD